VTSYNQRDSSFIQSNPWFPSGWGQGVLRRYVAKNRQLFSATHTATRIGQAIAYGLIAAGLTITVVTHLWLNGLWFIFIDWFLRDAAKASYQQH